MPRAPTTTVKPSVPVIASNRGKAKVAAGPRNFPSQYDDREDDTACPLCIEPLDATDLEFTPCPCGYKVCLFCFQRIQLECKNQCPGCRREYGKEDDMKSVSMGSDDGEARARAAQPSTSTARPPPGPAKGAATQAARRVETATPVKRTNAAMDEPSPGLPSGATWAANINRAQSMEGVERPPPPPPPPPPAAMDESAWPSLADSSAHTATKNAWPSLAETTQAQASARQKVDHDRDRDHHHQNHRRTMSMSTTTSADGVSSFTSLDQLGQDASTSAAQNPEPTFAAQQQTPSLASLQAQQQIQQQHHAQQQQQPQQPQQATQAHKPPPPGFRNAQPQQAQQQPQQQPQQSLQLPPHVANAFSSAQVATTVHGIRRAVNVPVAVNNLQVEPLPEAVAMQSHVQHQLREGQMSSHEAAMHLLQLLRPKEEQTRPAPAPISKPPPPGFAAPTMASSSAQPIQRPAASITQSLGPLNNLDNPVIAGPPSARLGAISPPQGHNQANKQASNAPGTYSLWSGLPGIDFSLNGSLGLWQQSTFQGSYNPLGLSPPGGSNIGVSQQDQVVNFNPMGVKAPPPGFGPASNTSSLSNWLPDNKTGTYRPPFGNPSAQQPIGARYNPLEQFSTARNPAPGMPAYRPQLGTGL